MVQEDWEELVESDRVKSEEGVCDEVDDRLPCEDFRHGRPRENRLGIALVICGFIVGCF